MSSTLHVDKEFAALCPALTAEELNLLEASITRDGCRDAIITWANHNDTIIDGHNRYAICRRFDVPFKTKAMKLETREDAIRWIIENQLGRRNLTDEQREYLRGKRYELSKKAEGGRTDRDLSGGQNDHPKTAEVIAEELGVSEATIRRDAKFARAVDAIGEKLGDDAKKKILSGQCKLGKAAIVEAAQLPAKKMARAIEDGELPVLNPKASNAMHYATLAICQLERIADDDPGREEALGKVLTWIKARRK